MHQADNAWIPEGAQLLRGRPAKPAPLPTTGLSKRIYSRPSTGSKLNRHDRRALNRMAMPRRERELDKWLRDNCMLVAKIEGWRAGQQKALLG